MLNKLLVPLDGSPLAERALEVGLRIARGNGDELLLLCIPNKELNHATEPAGELQSEPLTELPQNKARAYLKKITITRQDSICQLQTRVKDGDAARVILETAAAEDVALIVMTAHGHSGLRRWLGGVAESVLHDAKCPVLVVRSAMPPSKILVTLDGSGLAELALGPAVSVAQRLGAELTLLHVLEGVADMEAMELGELALSGSGFSRFVEESDPVASQRAYLEDIARQLQPQVSQKVRTVVLTGSAAPHILEYAEAKQIDLIIMATHGHSGLRHRVFGGVVEKVLRGAESGLLVVRPAAHRLN
jgi:nucleotide-binding universal stress UspA family protein